MVFLEYINFEHNETAAELVRAAYDTPPLAFVHSYGCQQNVNDGERIKGVLVDIGYGLCDKPEDADLILFNTCAVREHAEQRVFGNVGALTHTKARNPNQIITVCGCMAQQKVVADKVKNSYHHVDLVLGPQAEWRLPELLHEVYTKNKRVFSIENEHGRIAEDLPIVREGGVRAWVSIMYGCNNFCSYCIVPYVRGRERSREPEKIIEDIPVVFPAPDWKVYQEMQTAKLLEVDSETITAMQAATLTGKLLQLCNGAMYDAEKQVHPLNRCKLDAFGELIDALDGQKALVFYGFRFDEEQLTETLRARHKGLRFAVLRSGQDAADWNTGKLDVLLAQPASCAYGLNLQQGGHHLIWYSLPWSLELYAQGEARLYRQGQTQSVIVHRLIVKGGADEMVVKALNRKDTDQNSLMQAVKTHIKAAQRGDSK